MATTGHGLPLFPQPPASVLAATPMPGVASSYLPAQGSGNPPRDPRLRITPTRTLPSPYEPFPSQNLSGPPSADPPIPAFIRLQPAFSTRQGDVSPMPSPQFDPLPPRRNFTMPIPDTHVSHGRYTSYALQAPITSTYGPLLGATQIHPDRQRDQDNSDYEEDGDNSDISTLYDGGTLAKGPYTAGRPAAGEQTVPKPGNHKEQGPVRAQTLATSSLLLTAGINGPPNSPPSGPPNNFLARIRKLGIRRPQPPSQTGVLTTTVQPPQQATIHCRLCQLSLTNELSTRLGGFCCDKHMWCAIKRGVATKCPKCKRRACPEGQAFCSASCANV